MWEIQIIKENPENILLTRVVKLFNFGSARVFSELFPVYKKEFVKMQCHTIKAVACIFMNKILPASLPSNLYTIA